jgi:microcystin-dependent protein
VSKFNSSASTVPGLIQRLVTMFNKGIGPDNLTESYYTKTEVDSSVMESFLQAAYDKHWEVGSKQQWDWLDLPSQGFWGTHGWLWLDGRTIGDASSGATALANANAEALFTKIWTDYNDTTAPIFTSTGGASTRGASAADDWAAHKRITLVPDTRGRTLIGMDNYGEGGSAANRITDSQADVLGGSGGTETHTLTAAQNGLHRHKLASGNTGGYGNDCAMMSRSTANSGVGSAALTSVPAVSYYDTDYAGHQLVENSGTGAAHPNDQPWVAGKMIIRY